MGSIYIEVSHCFEMSGRLYLNQENANENLVFHCHYGVQQNYSLNSAQWVRKAFQNVTLRVTLIENWIPN